MSETDIAAAVLAALLLCVVAYCGGVVLGYL